MVNPSVSTINKIAKINSQSLVFLQEQGRVPGDIFLDGPNNARGSRLRGAAAEKLDAGEPDAEDPVELASAASGSPFEDDLREGSGRAIGGRGVGGEDRGLSVGEGEVVGEDEVGTGGCRFGEFDGFGDFEVDSGWGVV